MKKSEHFGNVNLLKNKPHKKKYDWLEITESFSNLGHLVTERHLFIAAVFRFWNTTYG